MYVDPGLGSQLALFQQSKPRNLISLIDIASGLEEPSAPTAAVVTCGILRNANRQAGSNTIGRDG
jgi:hypothetical protein